MKKTWLERRFEKLRKRFGKYSFLKYPVIFEMMVLLWADKILKYFNNNTKRFSSIVIVGGFFIVSCSFALPSFIEVVDINGSVEKSTTSSKQIESVESILENIGEIVIDDEELLDGYTDEVIDKNVDLYSIDEILEVDREEKINSDFAHIDILKSEDSQISKEMTFDPSDWRLLLVNKQNPIPEDYTFELSTIKGSMECDTRVLPDLLALLQGAKEDGISLVVISPYRDMTRQEFLFERHVQEYMNKGLSYMEAYTLSGKSVTVPGASEHQIGLAIDIVCSSYQMLNEGFADTESGKWLAANAHEYGFTLRYPKGKEYITGISFEPWHFRYVGVEAATVMKEQSLTLEELVENL